MPLLRTIPLILLSACTGAPDSKPAQTPTHDSAETGTSDLDGDGAPDDEDCAPEDGAVFPGAAETCDGVDQDCDGVADDEPIDAGAWYADADDDGYGDASASVLTCDAPAGTSADASDCNDADPAISPVGVEVCGDGIDQDCSGADCEVSTQTWGPGEATYVIHGTTAGGHLGSSLAVLDHDGDGVTDLTVNASQANGVQIRLFLGPLLADRLDTDADATWGTDSSYASLEHVANARDLDADGDDELLATDLTWPYRTGVSYGLLGGPGVTGGTLPDVADVTWSAMLPSAHLSVGDADGDGRPDVGVGSPYSRAGVYSAGTLYLVANGDALNGGTLSTEAAGWIEGRTADASIGDRDRTAGAMDLDGDGIDDIAVAASDTGTTWIIRGQDPLPALYVEDADAALTGAVATVHAGGDLTGDGLDDLLLGDDDGDTLCVVPGAAALEDGVTSDRATTTIPGSGVTWFAHGIAHGDVEGDGDEDLLISVQNDATYGTSSGAAWLLTGPLPTGALDTTTVAAVFHGDAAQQFFGGEALELADIDDDGGLDLLLPAVGADGVGAVYVYAGGGWW